MKKGFTLIELLVVMVMVSMLAALLVPLIARSREGELVTQCRMNLSQIGKAITMYANDNDGFFPEWNNGTWVEKRSDSWGHPGVHDQKAVGRVTTGKYAERGRSFEENPFIGAIFGTTMGCKVPGLNGVTAPESQWWNCTPERPAAPVGLGRLVSQKYLGDKSPESLYCPGSSAGELVEDNDLDVVTEYDDDEPFWTSKGTVVLANSNGVGDLAETKMQGYTCWTGTKTIPASHCQVYLNYTIRTLKGHYKTIKTDRPEHDQGNFGNLAPHDIAIKLAEAGNVGIVSDSIDPWFGWERVKEIYPPYTGVWPDGISEKYTFARKLARLNHDKSYNILFADGSVKTYTDDDGKLFNRLVDVWICNNTGGGVMPSGGGADNNNETYTNNYTPDGVMWADKFIFTPIFDTAYGN